MKVNIISNKTIRLVVPKMEANRHYSLTSRKNHFIGMLFEVDGMSILVKAIAGDKGVGELFWVDKNLFDIVKGVDLNDLYYKEYNLFW